MSDNTIRQLEMLEKKKGQIIINKPRDLLDGRRAEINVLQRTHKIHSLLNELALRKAKQLGFRLIKAEWLYD